MTAGNQDAIGAFLKGLQNIKGIDPAGAGNPDDPDVRGILDSADARQVCAGIGTPVADNGNDLRFPAAFFLFISQKLYFPIYSR
jgi:hypothetical protein